MIAQKTANAPSEQLRDREQLREDVASFSAAQVEEAEEVFVDFLRPRKPTIVVTLLVEDHGLDIARKANRLEERLAQEHEDFEVEVNVRAQQAAVAKRHDEDWFDDFGALVEQHPIGMPGSYRGS